MDLISHLLIYNLAISVLLYGSLAYNPRMWLHRMPPEVRRKVPEKTAEERKLFIRVAIPFLLWLFGYPIVYVLQRDLDLLSNFLVLCAFFGGFAVWDTLVLDLLIFCRFTPRFVIIAGTERQDYSNMKYHLVSGARGLMMSAIFSGLLALALTFFAGGSVMAKSVSVPVPEPDYWPTYGWQSSTPEMQGMDSGPLADMLEEISANQGRIHSVIVIRNGYMVTEAYFHPYTRDTKIHIQSVTKSVIGMLVGIAIRDGHTKSEDVRLVDFYQDRVFANPGSLKDSIQLRHLLSMSSGLPCQEFSASALSMEQSPDWVQFMLDLPMTGSPGKEFGYCNGNVHLLSSILEKTTGMSAREYANQQLFQPLGISSVDESDWGSDPQGTTIGGYGLHLTPADMARLALLNLNNGKWDDQQILPAEWVADSATEQIQKEDGSGYGYLWTVYPNAGHYAALGLGGQQIHVYPSRNLIVIVTASLESYAEAPEIEKMLSEYILPGIKADDALAGNPEAFARLETAIETASNPVQPVADLPQIAMQISGQTYTFEENPFGWGQLELVFQQGANTAQLTLNDSEVLEIGMDNIYRSSSGSMGEVLLRGRWVDHYTFVIDYPYPMSGVPVLGELGATSIQLKFTGTHLQVTIEQFPFDEENIVFEGMRTE